MFCSPTPRVYAARADRDCTRQKEVFVESRHLIMATTRAAAQWIPRRSKIPRFQWDAFFVGYKRPSALRGGFADGAHPNDVYFAPLRGELEYGIYVEREHTIDGHTAMSIAMDHLLEDPRYYQALESMERELKRSRVRTQRGARGDRKYR